MNVYSIILARKGSKSILKKNIQLLNGKPLMQYSIEYSLASSQVAHTIVSTDCEDIAALATKGGAEVPFIRPSEYAQDDTPDFPVMRHALDTMEEINNEKIDVLVLLRPTSPLRPNGLIEKGLMLLQAHPEATSVRSVSLCEQHPFRHWQIEGEYMVGYEKEIAEPYNIPRQKLPKVYFQTGDIELVRRETLLNGSVSGEKILPLIIHADEVVDIDHEMDLKEAQRRLDLVKNV